MRMVILGSLQAYASHLNDIHNTLWLKTVEAEAHYCV